MYVLLYRSFARSFRALFRTHSFWPVSQFRTDRHTVPPFWVVILFCFLSSPLASFFVCLLFVVVFCYWCFVYHSFVRSNCTANVLLSLLCWTVSYRQIVQLVSVRLFAPPFLTVFLYCEYLSVQSFCTISMCLV